MATMAGINNCLQPSLLFSGQDGSSSCGEPQRLCKHTATHCSVHGLLGIICVYSSITLLLCSNKWNSKSQCIRGRLSSFDFDCLTHLCCLFQDWNMFLESFAHLEFCVQGNSSEAATYLTTDRTTAHPSLSSRDIRSSQSPLADETSPPASDGIAYRYKCIHCAMESGLLTFHLFFHAATILYPCW
jgi:hypothetical protein